MAAFDLTAADPLMKIHFSPTIRKQFNTAAVLYNLLQLDKQGIPISNRGLEIPVHTGPATDFSWFDEGGPMPEGNGQVVNRSTAFYKRFAMAVLFTGDAIDATNGGDAVAYAKAMAFNLKNATTDAIKYLNIYSYLDGTGFLALSNADNQNLDSGSATAFTVDDSRYLRKNMLLDIHDGVTSTVLGRVRINSIDSATQITVTKVSGTLTDVDTGDGILVAGSFNKVLSGLDLLIDNTDVSGGVQGLDRGDVPEWQANVITLSGSPALSRDHLRRAVAQPEISLGEGSRSDLVIISHQSQLHAYADMGWPMKRFQGGGAGKLDLGFTAYEWEGIQWIVDSDAPKNKLYMLNKSSLFKTVAKQLGFDDRTGHILRQVPSSTVGRYDDKFVAYLVARMNLGIYTPRANTKVEGLAVTTGY